MSEAMRQVNDSLAVDIALLPYDVATNRVWAEALADIGILTKEELRRIKRALLQIEKEYHAGTYTTLPGDEDVHSLVERRLTELAGQSGAKIHTGRSRNDQVITDTRLYLRATIEGLLANIRQLVAALVKEATSHQKTILPAFTHVQHAQPVSLAHYLLSLAFSLKEDAENFTHLQKGLLSRCPLGSGAVAGSAFLIDRRKVAKALGFQSATPNSIQAVSNRDEILLTQSFIATSMIHLSRYAEDWIVWSSQEFGYLSLDESLSTGSSMMPQKKNPDSLELIRGKSARILGNMVNAFTLLKALPLSYSRDLQEDKAPLFDSITQYGRCLKLMRDVVATTTWHHEQMLHHLEGGLLATDLADYLSRKGLPFRKAHEVAATIVRHSLENHIDLRDYTAVALRSFSPLFGNDIARHLTFEASLKARNLIGGTAPQSVKRQLGELRRWLKHS